MTQTAAGLDAADLRRWGACLLAVLLLHASVGLALLARAALTPPRSVQAAPAIILDLPAVAEAPAERPLVQPTPPSSAAVPPRARSEPSRREPPEPPPALQPAVSLPAARPSPSEPVSRPVVESPPARPASSPSAARGPQAASWRQQLMAQFQRHKRYPREARRWKQEGVAQLRFAMDRDGRVLSARIERSSGFEALDAETLAMIERAQPLPAPPPEVEGARFELVVPIDYSLRP